MNDMWKEWLFNRASWFSFFLVLGIQLNAQNLIRNGSFEDTLSCPNAPNQLNKAIGWFSPNIGQGILPTPDLFHSCSNQVSVYSNSIGAEPPRTGEAFAGFGIMNVSPNLDFTEYVSSKLMQPLKEGQQYRLSFYLSLADLSPYKTDSISIHFSQDSLPSIFNNYYSIAPTLTLYIREITYYGWLEVSAVFEGSLDYRYITIGHFKNFDELNILEGNSASPLAYQDLVYLFIEDIELYPLDYKIELMDTGLCVNEAVRFEVTYYEDMSYAWYYDGVQISDSCCPVIDNPSAGWYYLEYTDFRGDTYRDSMYVSLKNCAEESIIDEPGVFQEQEHFLSLPTWFAPTQSQYWHPQWRDIEYWEIAVFNGLGQVVHRYTGTPELHPGWDGYSMASGVYCAVVNARAYNGEQMRAVEKVMVLR